MNIPIKLEVKIAAAGFTEDDCARCPASNCHWDDEYGCAFVWYNIFKNTIEQPKGVTQ